MEALYENTTVLTREFVLEVYRSWYRVVHRRAYIYSLSSGGLILAYALWRVLTYLDGPIYHALPHLVIAAIGIFFILSSVKGYQIYFRRYYKTVMAMYAEGKVTYFFYEDGIGMINRIPYANVTRIIETEHACCLLFEDSILMIAKDGFTKGKYPVFRAQLADHCLQARV